MRIRLFITLLLLPVLARAQERVHITGRIVNEKGDAIEYVQVGVPKLGIGTISSVDGRFEINVPADTLEFHHVSYQTGFHPVTGPDNDAVIVLKESELPPAVFIGGDTKEKYLLHAGTRIPGGTGDFNCTSGVFEGMEMGSVVNVRKPFMIKDILFSIRKNYIPGCVASINIFRIQGEPEEFINILRKPIYVNVALSDEKQDFDIQPEEMIMLDPGRYFISFELVDSDEDSFREFLETPETDRDPSAMHLYTFLYLKSSYHRFLVLGKLVSMPVNIGISVKGLEYQ